jgi:UDP-3-O-[3-hydroxymyristoyl] glucosamine N-acyltransferase
MKLFPKPVRLGDLSEQLQTVLHGNPDCTIQRLMSLEKAQPGDISFLSSRLYRRFLKTTQASAVIIAPDDVNICPTNALVAQNPRFALAQLVRTVFIEELPKQGVHPSAIIGARVSIAETAYIGPHCVIGDDVVIGEHSVLHAQVTLYDHVRIGKRVMIHSGTVIGSDGFGFAQMGGEWIKMPHLGAVVIEDQVEIGANTTIDRGFLEDTVIETGVIIDNLVQVGHNVIIGAKTAIAAGVAIAGSAKIGKRCLLGGAVSIAGHIELADDVHVTATSAVNHSLTQAGPYSSGFPAKPSAQWRRNAARFHYLDHMAVRLKQVEKKLEDR